MPCSSETLFKTTASECQTKQQVVVLCCFAGAVMEKTQSLCCCCPETVEGCSSLASIRTNVMECASVQGLCFQDLKSEFGDCFESCYGQPSEQVQVFEGYSRCCFEWLALGHSRLERFELICFSSPH